LPEEPQVETMMTSDGVDNSLEQIRGLTSWTTGWSDMSTPFLICVA
jgi:hypothetical protein